jgi:peptidoglycan LD-endopeptidase LytH
MGVRIGNFFNLKVILSKRLVVVLLCLCIFQSSFVTATEDSQLKIGPPLDSLKTTELHDSFNEIHHGHRHEAIDIMRPRGTPIRAVIDGFIRKVFISRQGGLTIYEFDRESAYCFYYAHLDRYADTISEGMPVARGDVIGYVGTTGDAQPNAPQLHFAIFKLGSDKSWWKGEAINPYPILMRAVTEAQSVRVRRGPLRDFRNRNRLRWREAIRDPENHRLKPVPPLGQDDKPLQERGWPYGFNIFSSPVSVA